MKKIFILGLLLFLILSICNACRNPIIYKRDPCRQKNTKWSSEDGSIVFKVLDTGGAIGKMIVDNSEIEFYLCTDMGGSMHLYPIHVNETKIIYPEEEYEYWECSYKSKNKFVATVEKTTFLKEGEKITFNKVSDNT